MKWFLLVLLLLYGASAGAKTYYVAPPTASPAGSDTNPGTILKPWGTWQKAFDTATSGDTVFFRGGVWYPTVAVLLDPDDNHGHNGTFTDPICFFNYPGETPILDCIKFISTVNANALDIRNCTYIKFKGLTVTRVNQLVSDQYIDAIQIYLCGNIWLENMTSHHNEGHGFQFYSYDTLRVINCDSYNNADSISYREGIGNRADGFSMGSGESDVDTFKILYISGCRAWRNSDDGFDVGSTKQFDISNCWSFLNGYLPEGGGVGFKTTYSLVKIPSKRKIYKTIAAFNQYSGYAAQNQLIAEIGSVGEFLNNTSYRCRMGFESDQGDFVCSSGFARTIFRNNLVYKSTYSSYYDQTYLDQCSSSKNIIDHNTWNYSTEHPYWIYNPAFTVTNDDFVFVGYNASDSLVAITQLAASRKTDGTLPDITFLKLKEGSDLIDAGVDVGLPYVGSAPDIGAFEYGSSGNNQQLVESIIVTAAGDATSISTDNGTLLLSATVLPANATNRTVKWSISSGSDNATISSSGLVTALGNGIVVARATANDGSGVYGTYSVAISGQIVPVTSISVTGTGGVSTISTDNGTLQLIANVQPTNATDNAVIWSITSGSDKAMVNSAGLITAIDNGTVVVQAAASDGSGVYGSLTITISNQVILVTNISVTGAGGATSIVTDNGTLQLTATILPGNATIKTVTWSLTNGSDKASISSTGLVTALDNGTVVARAIATDGSGVYGILTLTISNQIVPVSSITVTGTGGATLITLIGATLQLVATVLPANATSRSVTWSITSGADKATITSTGLVTAQANGTVVARATANDGSGIYGVLIITISDQVIPVTSITITGAGGLSAISTDNGTLQLSAEVTPANASDKTVTWSITSGADKASISSGGMVTALDNGTTVARATANDGSGVYGTLVITISNQIIPVLNIIVTGSGGVSTINTDNGTLQLISDVQPANATNKSVVWSIVSGSEKASINTSGLITAVDNGAVIARATATDGTGVYGTITITISNQVIPVVSITVTGAGGASEIKENNGTLQLSADVIPVNATNKTVIWSITSGADKASVSSTGLVTAIENGTLAVRAAATDGSGIYGEYVITVSFSENPPTYTNPVTIYPVPAGNLFYLQINDSKISVDFIKIISLSGEVMIDEKLNPDLNFYTFPINLKTGLYIVQIGKEGNTVNSQKLLVVR